MKLNKKTIHISQLAELTPLGLVVYTDGDVGQCVIGLELRKDKKLHITDAFDCYYDSEQNEDVKEAISIADALDRWGEKAKRVGACLIIGGELVPTAFVGIAPYEVTSLDSDF